MVSDNSASNMNSSVSGTKRQAAYQCVICGYIHIGDAPPKNCPICGADREEFEPYEQTLPLVEQGETEFRCLNCEYIHHGDEAPFLCPVCGLSGDNFEKIVEGKISGELLPLEHIVVIGGGIAGVSAVETIREYTDAVKITFISGEEKLPYYRLNLTRLLGAEIGEEELCIHPQYWYDDQRVQVFKHKIITDISPVKKEITLNDRTILSYDKLICALGAHPFVPPIVGAETEKVVSIRSIEDVNQILTGFGEASKIVVIGGGVLGLEAAGALNARGHQVTVAEGSKWLMPRQLNNTAAKYVEMSLKNIGIQIEYEFKTIKIADKVYGADGRNLEADLVVLATGVRPNTYLVRKAGLEVNQGLVVDNYMKTSDPHIYAAGDITEHYGIVYGLWNIAKYQGKIAALNILGKKVPFGGVPRSNALKVLNIDLFSIGDFTPIDASYTLLEQMTENGYLLFVFKDQILVGSIVIGYKSITHKVKASVEKNQHFSTSELEDIQVVLEKIIGGTL